MISILKVKLVLFESGSTPIIFTKKVPKGFIWATPISPVLEFTLIKSFSKFRACPSSGSTPEYFQIQLPQLGVAENGVIFKY